jgi:hypothetical protein
VDIGRGGEPVHGGIEQAPELIGRRLADGM